ncbi:MAG: molecular chaperone DnaK [Myxococcales bacterium]|nr:molecular chaperone DnaK [Myxococcales bacterium]MCB9521189.1 molecular chaperone DnaK [Myxococcales bacterium]MCB9530547.1 molecular chaperone DnaK [Myxococcales bacterium]
MSRVIGIDLGTTNSCVAVTIDNETLVIANSEGSRTTPSVVALTESGERLIGQLAKRQAVTNPENTAVAVKRLIGRRFDDDSVELAKKAVAYEITRGTNGDAVVKLRDRVLSPAEISAHILQKMKQTAEDYLGEEVTEAIITVPAHFSDAQRQATRDAGRIAGLDVLRIINEPTAAALAYGTQTAKDGVFAVYDLGGGTFDITILRVAAGVFEVASTSGDNFLGGEDFDRRLVDMLADGFQNEHGIDLRADRMALQRLREAAEKAKHELSSRNVTDVNLPFISAGPTGPLHLARPVSRDELEAIVGDLVDRTIEPCRDALKQSGLKTKDITEVILVGGMTRMPLVRQRVASFFGKEPSTNVNPDEVVAIGAATQGGVLRGEVQDVLLLDVCPLSLGVETQGGVFSALIPRNTTIPVTVSEVYTTAVDNQPFVQVHVLQGERPLAADNTSLAKFDLVGIPPAPRGIPEIEVLFHIDANGIVEVTARDLGTGKAQQVRVNAAGGLSEQQIQSIIDDAERYRAADADAKELAELRNRAEGLMYTTDRSLDEYADHFTDDQIVAIDTALKQCREVLDRRANAQDLHEAIAVLEAAAYQLADAMYAAAQRGPA